MRPMLAVLRAPQRSLFDMLAMINPSCPRASLQAPLAIILLTVECSKHGLNRALRFDLGLSGVTPGNRV
jgi:hypothetical protein